MKTHFTNMTLHRQLQLLACVVAVALLAGCASNNYQRGSAAGAGLRASADKLDQDRDKIDAITTSLNDLANNPGDLVAQFKKYSASVSGFESVTREVNNKVNAMREQGDAYFAAWDRQVAQIQGEDLRN
ncbi:MAG TPA: hypothetical protein VFF11_03675, partial [Candidatus Binatia bacterium]|nr:hypothetical protein [Candidatus Binatia bacterium]